MNSKESYTEEVGEMIAVRVSTQRLGGSGGMLPQEIVKCTMRRTQTIIDVQ